MSGVTQAVLVVLKAASAAAATVTKTDNKVDASNATTYSFTSTNLGTPAAGRYLVVVAAGRGGSNRTINSCTVAGNTTTKLTNKGDASVDCAIFITDAADASNSSGTVSITCSGGFVNMGITVYEVNGLTSNAADGSPQTTATSGATMSLPVSAGGVAVGGCFALNGSAPNFTWSGLAEDVDQLNGESNSTMGSASLASAGATTISAICTATSTVSFNAACVALR